MFDRDEVDLCIKDPGFEVDLEVSCPLRDLTGVWPGHESPAEAQRRGRLRLEGRRGDVKAFRSWFVLDHFAPEGRKPARQPALRGLASA